ncbi:hypothetical protein FHX49_001100 [Microbacterium endophyticum]|uniref:Uncharacterized protein n=1 Tax=Microbacterium endophyticum TaxID=1526412 RepID=A0A7W4YMJ0_9MICO|nr:hypothetical protein [Microbacterium endophyticum]MBB2975534.1 hypothetical protein [Microbacterium endophyticum]NIK35447.1 hypothetical protein [Microbacterium endophyticum]
MIFATDDTYIVGNQDMISDRSVDFNGRISADIYVVPNGHASWSPYRYIWTCGEAFADYHVGAEDPSVNAPGAERV